MSGSGRRRIMVVGIGNPDRADDGAGLAVASHLAGRLPNDVALIARSGDILGLVQDWIGYDALICADAAAPMGQPGQVHRLDAADGKLPPGTSLTSSHAFGLAEAIALARELQLLPPTVTVYAIEGACFNAGAPMTPEVAAAVGQVAGLIAADCRLGAGPKPKSLIDRPAGYRNIGLRGPTRKVGPMFCTGLKTGLTPRLGGADAIFVRSYDAAEVGLAKSALAGLARRGFPGR